MSKETQEAKSAGEQSKTSSDSIKTLSILAAMGSEEAAEQLTELGVENPVIVDDDDDDDQGAETQGKGNEKSASKAQTDADDDDEEEEEEEEEGSGDDDEGSAAGGGLTDLFEDKSNGGNKKAVTAIVKAMSPEVQKLIKESIGMEAKVAIEKLASIPDIEAQLQANKTELQQINSEINSLPPAILKSIEEWSNGGDYAKAFAENVSAIDYNIPFSKQDKESLVKALRPKKFKALETDLKKQEISADDFQDEISEIYDTLEADYEDAQADYKKKLQKIANEAKQQKASFEKSVEKSMEFLNKELPGVKESVINRAKDIVIKSGGAMFLNSDGTVREDAIVMAVMATNYKSIIKAITEKAEGRGAAAGRTKEAEKIVSNGKNKQDRKKDADGGGKQEIPLHLRSMGRRDVYAHKPN